jgi:hypothetical protein
LLRLAENIPGFAEEVKRLRKKCAAAPSEMLLEYMTILHFLLMHLMI